MHDDCSPGGWQLNIVAAMSLNIHTWCEYDRRPSGLFRLFSSLTICCSASSKLISREWFYSMMASRSDFWNRSSCFTSSSFRWVSWWKTFRQCAWSCKFVILGGAGAQVCFRVPTEHIRFWWIQPYLVFGVWNIDVYGQRCALGCWRYQGSTTQLTKDLADLLRVSARACPTVLVAHSTLYERSVLLRTYVSNTNNKWRWHSVFTVQWNIKQWSSKNVAIHSGKLRENKPYSTLTANMSQNRCYEMNNYRSRSRECWWPEMSFSLVINSPLDWVWQLPDYTGGRA